MNYVVIDTNVLISALIKPNTAPNQILKHILKHSLTLVLHKQIIEEYLDVIQRKKFRKYFELDLAKELIDILINNALFVEPIETKEHFDDIDDKIFYQIALNKIDNTQIYLITGNTSDFPKNKIVITPNSFINMFNK